MKDPVHIFFHMCVYMYKVTPWNHHNHPKFCFLQGYTAAELMAGVVRV